MELIRHQEFFNPVKITDEIHVIGVGAVGSQIVEALVRLGVKEIHIYDFDTVDTHNIPNQMFFDKNIGKSKCESLIEICTDINPEVKIVPHLKGYTAGTRLSGYIFLGVDSIELRKAIITEHLYNNQIIAVYDTRMGLKTAQHYATYWDDKKGIEQLQKTMDFTDAEAKESQPVSACGSSLNVLPTIRIIASFAVTNWMCMVRDTPYKKTILLNTFDFTVDAF